MRFFFRYVFPPIVLIFSINHLSKFDWKLSVKYILSFDFKKICALIILVSLNYFLLSCFDIFILKFFKSPLRPIKIGIIAFISYAFSLNLGSLVGSVGMRMKLYREQGISHHEISSVILQSIQSNWLGFSLVGSVYLILDHSDVGIFGLIGVISYLIFLSIKKQISFRHYKIEFLNTKTSILLLLVASLQWINQILILKILINEKFYKLLEAQFISSVTSLVSHIPGGLGIYETTMGEILKDKKNLLGGILGFRIFFYFFPFLISSILFVFRMRKPD